MSFNKLLRKDKLLLLLMHWFCPGLELQIPLNVSYMKFADSLAFLHSFLWIPFVVIHKPSKCPSQVTHTQNQITLWIILKQMFSDVCLYSKPCLHTNTGEKKLHRFINAHIWSPFYNIFLKTVCFLNCHGTCNPSSVGLCSIYDLHL